MLTGTPRSSFDGAARPPDAHHERPSSSAPYESITRHAPHPHHRGLGRLRTRNQVPEFGSKRLYPKVLTQSGAIGTHVRRTIELSEDHQITQPTERERKPLEDALAQLDRTLVRPLLEAPPGRRLAIRFDDLAL